MFLKILSDSVNYENIIKERNLKKKSPLICKVSDGEND